MPSDPKALEIIEIVNTLKNDSDGANMRADIKLRLSQHAMTDIPWVPDYLMAAGKSVVMNSPTIPDLARQINAVMSSYTTTVTVVPGGPDLQAKADKVEKAYALRRQALFTPQVVSRNRWRQLIVGIDYYKLVCGSEQSPDPWSLIQPDPLSCFPLMGEESMRNMRPSRMGREYEQTIGDARKRYYDVREQKVPTYVKDKWDFEALSDPVAVGTGVPVFSHLSVTEEFRRAKFYEYDDSETTYVVGLNKDGKSGEVLWSRKNLTGGSSYVMVPGYMTGSTEMREKYLPHLWGPMNVQYQIDVINTLRATRSMNIKPQILMERSPELLKAAQQLGIMRPTPDGYESFGSDTIIELDGRPHFWTLPNDADLSALEQSKQNELQRLISTEMSLTQADIIKDAAVRNIQLALGVRSQQQGPMLTYEAIGEREILKMWSHSLTCEGGYGGSEIKPNEYKLYAKTGTPHGTDLLKPGEMVTARKLDFAFEHSVEVNTASMSEQERQFLVQAAVERKVTHIATWPQVLEASGVQNLAEQEELLVEEEGYEAASLFYGPWLAPTFRQRMAERAGILIPDVGPLIDDSGSQASISPSPNAFPVPQTEQVTGESGQ